MDWGNIFGDTASGALAGTAISPGWGTVIGGGLGLLGGLFGGNPAKKAQEQSQKGWQESQNYQNPYVTRGNDQYNRLNDASANLMNPMDLQNRWLEKYQTSPWANQLLSQSQVAGNDFASQWGLGGSSAAMSNAQQNAGNIVSNDRQNYMNDLMQKYMQGIGLSSDIYNTGAKSAQSLGEQAVGNGLVNAAFGYQGAQQPINNLIGGGSMLLNSYQKNPNLFDKGTSGWKGFFS